MPGGLARFGFADGTWWDVIKGEVTQVPDYDTPGYKAPETDCKLTSRVPDTVFSDAFARKDWVDLAKAMSRESRFTDCGLKLKDGTYRENLKLLPFAMVAEALNTRLQPLGLAKWRMSFVLSRTGQPIATGVVDHCSYRADVGGLHFECRIAKSSIKNHIDDKQPEGSLDNAPYHGSCLDPAPLPAGLTNELGYVTNADSDIQLSNDSSYITVRNVESCIFRGTTVLELKPKAP